MALCQHIGIEYSESITLTDTTFTTVAPTMLHAPPDSAVVQRDEYALLNKAIKAELLQKQLVRGEYLPQLAVGAQGLYLDMLDQQNTYGLAFATLSIPITDWWGGAHKLREHDMKIAIARNNLEEKSELLRLQIEKAYNELIENHEQIQVAASSVEQTREHLKVVRDNFQAGIMSTSDMLEAQAMHQEARDALVDAKSMYQIRQVSYRKAIGQLEY
jgi:outer membrane protein TolC